MLPQKVTTYMYCLAGAFEGETFAAWEQPTKVFSTMFWTRHTHLHDWFNIPRNAHLSESVLPQTFPTIILWYTSVCVQLNVRIVTFLLDSPCWLWWSPMPAARSFFPHLSKEIIAIKIVYMCLGHLPTASKRANISLNSSLRCSIFGSVLGILSLCFEIYDYINYRKLWLSSAPRY